MAYAIDPETGLPLLQDTNIDQIPLNAQVFPYDDLHAVERPIRGPAYPDDVLPTTAIVVGMDTTNPQAAQVVTTDGEHALRVYVVNPKSGGGAGPAVQVSGDGNVVTANTAFNNVDAGDPTMWNGNTRITIPVKGTYLVTFAQTVEPLPGPNYAANGADYIASSIIKVNGHPYAIDYATHDFASQYFTTAGQITDRVSALIDCDIGDYMQFVSAFNTFDMSITALTAYAHVARVM